MRVLTIGILLFSFFGYSQNNLIPEIDSLELKPYQIKKLGKLADKAGDTYSAIDYYLKYVEVKPQKARYKYIVAELYRRARDYEKALEWYNKVYEEVPEQFPMAKYYSSQMMIMAEADYKGALESFLEFKKAHKPAAKVKKTKKLMNAQMQGCEKAEDIMKDPLKMVVTHLDSTINKAHVEFSPILKNDSTLIYAAVKENEINYYYTDVDSTPPPVRQFYVARKVFGDWTGEEPLPGPFNDSTINTGNGAFSPDGERFYFTRCEPKKGKIICAIYLSSKDSVGNWGTPEKLPEDINNPDFTSTQPTVGVEPKRGYEALYFISDRDGGKGGKDIWYTYYIPKKEAYKTVKNAGSGINTIGDEVTPYYDMETKTMYFSSEGWPGLGGFDIFKTTGQLNKWILPENVGVPLNSNQDDLDFTISKDQEDGFFVSNRPGGTQLKSETCCDDIYQFHYTQYIKIFVSGHLYEFQEIEDSTTTNEQTEEHYIVDATVDLLLVDPESGDKIDIKKVYTNDKGNYFMKLEAGNNYELVMSKKGYLKHEVSFSTKDITESDTIHLDGVWLVASPDQPVILKNIYYPFDKDHLTESSKLVVDTTLFKILIDNPEIIVEISSHTDSKGSDSYNHDLSQRRAESVVNYLIEKGIDKKRMKAKGYGEEKPIAPNQNEDGSDNEAGRAKNRRTDFKVIGTVKGVSEIIYED